MRQFNYTLKEPIGIHARSAGLLAKAVKALDSTVTIEKAGSEPVLANRLMALMGLGVKCGDTVTLTLSGGDEEGNLRTLERFFEEHL